MRLHAHLEERVIHTLLSQRVPGGARQLEEDHRVIRQEFDNLVTNFEGIRAKPIDFEKRGELAIEFYRAWSRFMTSYFVHINREEEHTMPVLWKLCTVEELVEIHKLIITNQTQEELVEDFEMMLPNVNLQEPVEILEQVEVTMSPEAYQAFLKLAERILEPKDWTTQDKTWIGHRICSN
jgi:hypothetical protein